MQRGQLQRTSDFTPYPGWPGSELSWVTGQLWGRRGDEFQHHLWVLFLAFRQGPCPYWGRKDSCLGSSFVVCHPSNWKQVLPLLSSSVYLGWWMCLSHLISLKRTAPFSQFWEATRKMLVGNVKLVAVYLPQHRPMTSDCHHSWTGQQPTLALPLSIEGSRNSLCFSTGNSLHLLPNPHQRPETLRQMVGCAWHVRSQMARFQCIGRKHLMSIFSAFLLRQPRLRKQGNPWTNPFLCA